jgi:hypothetical protein
MICLVCRDRRQWEVVIDGGGVVDRLRRLFAIIGVISVLHAG